LTFFNLNNLIGVSIWIRFVLHKKQKIMATRIEQFIYKEVDLDLFIEEEAPEDETNYSGYFDIYKIEIAGMDATELLEYQLDEIEQEFLKQY